MRERYSVTCILHPGLKKKSKGLETWRQEHETPSHYR